MLVTELGIVIEASFSQPENALLPMLFTELPIVTEVNLLQSLNALTPTLETLNVLPATTVLGITTSPE